MSEDTGTGFRPGDQLMIAAWAAIMTGLGEAVLLGVQKVALHRLIFLSADAIWMASVANLLFFALPGLVLWVLARRPGGLAPRTTILIFAYLGLQSLLFMYAPLHKGAAMLLALGVGIQSSRVLAARAPAFLALVRRTTLWLALLVGALAVGLPGWRALAERRRLAGLPDAGGKPNVLLIILDTVRAFNLGLYGYDRNTTPNLDKWARSGVVFDRAFATAPWTLPSHAGMFTGHLPPDLTADWNIPLDRRWPTVAEVMDRAGYATAGFVGNTIYATRETGLDRGFAHYEDYPVSLAQIIKSSSLGRAITGRRSVRRFVHNYTPLAHKDAAQVNREFERWLSHHGDRPFFAFLNYFDTHSPYLPRPPYDGRFGPTGPRSNVGLDPQGGWTEEQVSRHRNAYDACLAYLDEQLGQLFADLERRGALENTVVVLVADHGEEFHEHGVMEHGNSLYRPSVQVPLIVVYPRAVPANRRVEASVSLRDIPATLVELAGIGSAPFPGQSLARFWRQGGASAGADTVYSSLSPTPGLPEHYPAAKDSIRSVILDHWRYIRRGRSVEELYDLDQDPLEQRDLAGTAEGRAALPGLRGALEAMLTRGSVTR